MDEHIINLKKGYAKVLFKYIYNNYLISVDDDFNRIKEFKAEFNEQMKRYPTIFLNVINRVNETASCDDVLEGYREFDEIFEFLDGIKEDLIMRDDEIDKLEEDYTKLLTKYLCIEFLYDGDFLNIMYSFKKDFKQEMKRHPGVFLKVIDALKEEFIEEYGDYDEYDDWDNPICLLNELEEKVSNYTIVYL